MYVLGASAAAAAASLLAHVFSAHAACELLSLYDSGSVVSSADRDLYSSAKYGAEAEAEVKVEGSVLDTLRRSHTCAKRPPHNPVIKAVKGQDGKSSNIRSNNGGGGSSSGGDIGGEKGPGAGMVSCQVMSDVEDEVRSAATELQHLLAKEPQHLLALLFLIFSLLNLLTCVALMKPHRCWGWGWG